MNEKFKFGDIEINGILMQKHWHVFFCENGSEELEQDWCGYWLGKASRLINDLSIEKTG